MNLKEALDALEATLRVKDPMEKAIEIVNARHQVERVVKRMEACRVWEEARFTASCAAIGGLLANPQIVNTYSKQEMANLAVEAADRMISKLAGY